MTPRTAASAFRVVAVAEACSWIGLLIGMFVKYVPETTELGVKIFGPIHGGIFVAYLLLTVLTARALRWDVRTMLLAFAAAVPPLVTVWFERWATRTGRIPSQGVVAA